MKKLILIVIIIFIIIYGVTLYLNKILLPKKFKALITSTLSQQIGKNVTLKSLEFSIFKGLILRDLVIADSGGVILSTRQATCSIFIWPIFKKQIIIPSLNFKAPHIFLERRQDGSFNLQDLFLLTKPAAKKSDFGIAVFKLTISNGNIVFQDDTLPNQVKKEIKNIQLSLQLGLPVKVKFNLTAQLVAQPLVLVNASGEYKILNQELDGNFSFKDLSISEFSAYYGDLSSVVFGLIDLQAKVNLKNKNLKVDLAYQGNNLTFTKENLKVKLNSSLQSKIDYNLETKKLEFNGTCDISQANISGLEFLGPINNLNGKLVFNQNSLIADSLKAEFLGVPFKIKLGIKDFSTRILTINTDFDLSIIPAIAKEKFNLALINSATGKAALAVRMYPDKQGAWAVSGSLDISDAVLKLDKLENPVEDMVARIGFSQEGLNWTNAKFKYQSVKYQSIGSLTNFTAPTVKLKLYGDDLSLSTDFDLLGKKIKIAQLKGKYLDSQFLISGDIDQSDPASPQADLNGTVDLELDNLNKFLEKIYPQIKALALSGQVTTQFNLSGPLKDFKNCNLEAKSTSNSFSLYGLKATDFYSEFLLAQKIAKVSAAYFTFYDGVIQGSGALNLNADNLAYQLEVKSIGINLAKLKNDTTSRAKNIAGIFLGEIKLNGSGSDLNKLGGFGSFRVSHGRLGGLNLLQGLGKLLLAKDLGTIEFTGCSCDFLIKDKFVFTENFQLVSPITELIGNLKFGFDRSLEGALDVHIIAESVPLEGTIRDVTTAIVGQGGKFGVIKIKGTMDDPKYAFKTEVGNIIQGLTNLFFKK